ncbi:MAG: hypothetical protein ACRD8O_16105 [Bryobacteraceae bacterium]
MRRLALLAALAASAAAEERYSYWIEHCTPQLSRDSGCQAGDPELAEWALHAWRDASGGAISLARTTDESRARIRIYWAPGAMKLYGEAHPIVVDGKRGAAVYVRPTLGSFGPEIEAAGRNDPLFRHTVVYLTCLHESGHAIGLPHTIEFADIMYSFRYGGDIVEYFARYRRKLAKREDIRRNSGISEADRKRASAGL